ncbi:unnamed protein product [Heterobilharzia americana]|nr:unnamed protein product [Heterobilharzia americana]
MEDSEGNLVITREEKQSKRWADHFKKLSSRPPPPPATRPEIPPAAQPRNTSRLTKVKVLNSIKSLKARKAVGPDGIPPEALKTDAETSAVDMLTPLLQKVWKEGKVPAHQLEEGLPCQAPKEG